MQNVIKGRDFALYVELNGGNVIVCYARDCSLNLSRDVIETTTKNGGKGKTYKYKRSGYTLSVSGLMNAVPGNGFTLQEALRQGLKINWTFTDDVNLRYTGRVLVTSATMDSPMDGVSSFSNELLGDGDYVPTQLGTAITTLAARIANPTVVDVTNNRTPVRVVIATNGAENQPLTGGDVPKGYYASDAYVVADDGGADWSRIKLQSDGGYLLYTYSEDTTVIFI